MEKKILLVDDEKDIREVVHLSLSDMGYQVLEAEDGDQALRIFRDTQPPIVLTDIKMPKASGVDLFNELLSKVGTDIPILFLSGFIGDLDKQGLPKNVHIFSKPFSSDELLGRIEELCAA